MSNKNTKIITITEFECDEGLKKLKVPFEIKVRHSSSGYIAESEVFDFHIKKDTIKEVIAEIQFEFAFINDFYLGCASLSYEGMRIRREFEKLI